jgi:hypothetical protein
MKLTRKNSKEVACEMTALGYVPTKDMATLAALILATDNAYTQNSTIYNAIREANRILLAVSGKLNPSDPFA